MFITSNRSFVLGGKRSGETHKKKPLAERFWAKVTRHPDPVRPVPLKLLSPEKIDSLTPEEKGCWEFCSAQGKPLRYGNISEGIGGGKEARYLAHELGFILQGGELSEDRKRFPLDHLCRNPACVKKSHLEIVTRRENILRGTGRTAFLARKKICKGGHELNDKNTRVNPNGSRTCRICEREKTKRNRAKRKAEV